MGEAGRRCGLFTPSVEGALEAAALQARGAALRSGSTPLDLEGVRRRAANVADRAPCRGPDLTRAAARVRDAFRAYAALGALDFPGTAAAWRADRTAARSGRPDALVLSSTARGAAIVLPVGVVRDGRLVVRLPRAWRPAAARLLLRDPQKSAEPFLGRPGAGLAGRAPPPALSRPVFASELAPSADPGSGVLAYFPPRAVDAVAALDPREAVVVEALGPDLVARPDQRAVLEVGDLAAARAFLAAGR